MGAAGPGRAPGLLPRFLAPGRRGFRMPVGRPGEPVATRTDRI